jgi:hypothetical protein
MKQETNREKILRCLTAGAKMSCAQICNSIAIRDLYGTHALYLSASISSDLRKMVRDGVLKYSDSYGPRGGWVYEKV